MEFFTDKTELRIYAVLTLRAFNNCSTSPTVTIRSRISQRGCINPTGEGANLRVRCSDCFGRGGGVCRGGGVSAQRKGVCPGEDLPAGGGGRCLSAGQPPPGRMTDTCKNITLPQLRCGWC